MGVGVWMCVRVCLHKPVCQAAVQHCEMGSKPQGGDPTALWAQNGHSPLTSAHVGSQRVTTSCSLTTTPKQAPLWLYFICFISTGNTQHSRVPRKPNLNMIFFSVTSCASVTVTFSFPPAQISQCSLAFEYFFFPPRHANTDKQAACKHPEWYYAQ